MEITSKLFNQMKRFAMPLVRSEQDWQQTLNDIKDEFDMPVNEDSYEVIMEVIRECERDCFE